MRLWDVIDRLNSHLSHYNHEKYWRYKQLLMNERTTTIKRVRYLYYMKKCESYNNASLGNRINGGSYFKTSPVLPHGIKGIFVSDKAIIGKNATIYQQVTIGVNSPGGDAPVIGDNVFIGAGAKILGDIHVGNNVKIGANCVVHFDIPDNSTVVLDACKIKTYGEQHRYVGGKDEE